MAIKGLRKEGGAPQLMEAGQIRLGVKKEGQKHPTKLDHFLLLKPDLGTGEMKPDAELHAKVGARPRKLLVYLAGQTPEECFHTSLDLYRARGKPRFCSGDNETAQVRMFPGDRCAVQDGHLVVQRKLTEGYSREPGRKILRTVNLEDLEADEAATEKAGFPVYQCGEQATKLTGCACPCPLLGAEGNIKCKPHGILRVFLASAGEFGAYHVFRTTSWKSIRNITGFLEDTYKSIGMLAGLKLHLNCQASRVNTPDGKTQKAMIAYLTAPCSPHEMFEEAKRLAISRHETVEVVRALNPPAYSLDEPRVVEEMQDEFHPDLDAEPPAPEDESQEPDFDPTQPDEEPSFVEDDDPDEASDHEDAGAEDDPFAAAGL